MSGTLQDILWGLLQAIGAGAIILLYRTIKDGNADRKKEAEKLETKVDDVKRDTTAIALITERSKAEIEGLQCDVIRIEAQGRSDQSANVERFHKIGTDLQSIHLKVVELDERTKYRGKE